MWSIIAPKISVFQPLNALGAGEAGLSLRASAFCTPKIVARGLTAGENAKREVVIWLF